MLITLPPPLQPPDPIVISYELYLLETLPPALKIRDQLEHLLLCCCTYSKQAGYFLYSKQYYGVPIPLNIEPSQQSAPARRY